MTTTDKSKILLHVLTKTDLASELGITRPTLNKRLSEETEWKTLEIKWINKLYKEL